MKPEMITLKVGDGTLKLPAATVAQFALAAFLGQVVPPQPAPSLPVGAVPPLGAIWPGQGGINGGFMTAQDGVPAHYLIFATNDVGKHKWGGYEKESAATSKHDGMANTKALLAEGGHPAAEAAAKYSADGHQDFCLPAAADLYQGWLKVPELFGKDWHWSSTQRSAYGAVSMHFDGGNQVSNDKTTELRVRPVRRVFI
jgi:hypothetical protein